MNHRPFPNRSTLLFVRRGSGLVRTLVVSTATLAILLVCFSIYQYSQLDPNASPENLSSHRLPSPGDPAASDLDATEAAAAPGVPVGQAVIGPGRDIKLSIYPREGTRARLEIAVRSWRPTGQGSNEFILEDPEARLRTTDGRAVRVTAREGLLEAQRRSGGGLDPLRGKLTGEVVIEIDRLTEQERARLPEALRDVLDPAQIVRVDLETIEFDLEYSRVIVPHGEVHLTARDADFRATDLEIHFNEAAGRVEYLRIDRGGRIELRDVGGDLALNLPGTRGEPEQRMTLVDWLRATIQARLAAQQAVAAAKPTEPGALPTSEFMDGTPLFRLQDKEATASKAPVRYFARFEDQVDARQLVGETVASQLQAEVLEILRSVSDQDKERVRATPSASTPVAEGKEPVPTQPTQRMVLGWEGKLVVEACTPDHPRCADEVRARITARGSAQSPVRMYGPSGSATCTALRFEPDAAAVWMEGTQADPVAVQSLEQGGMTGLALYSKQTPDDFQVEVKGPGTLTRAPASRGPAPVGPAPRVGNGASGVGSLGATARAAPASEAMIRFADQLVVAGRFETVTRLDFTGGIVSRRQRALDRATFTGGVTMQENDTTLSADEIALAFSPKRAWGDEPQTLDTIQGQGRVAMTQGADRMTCAEIDVQMTTTREGKTIPLRAAARSAVEAVQQERTIRAADSLIVDFAMIERPPPPFNAAQAYEAAVRAGLDPKQIDWTAKRREYEASRRTEVGIKRLQAEGAVIVTDPAQSLHLTTARLDCAVVNGREIEQALVLGTADQPASVSLNAFTVTGETIRLNVPDEWAEVPGPGRMTFRSQKDLDGRKLSAPIPIAITWREWMKYQGRENRSVFSGGVRATSSSSTTFDCSQLVVEFDDVAPSAKPSDPAQDWWIFSDLVPRAGRGSDSDLPKLAGGRFSKEPAYILATGNAVADVSELDESTGALKSRARLAGPKLSLNLRPDVSKLRIEGPGHLQLEDFRPPSTDSPKSAALESGLFGVDQNSGPSKTLIEWQESMWYDFSIDQTRFEGQVSLKHFSGAELIRLFDPSAAAGKGVPAGRSTFLSCDVLTADFLNREQRARNQDNQRMGRLSADRLRQFRAAGAVTLQDQHEGLFLTAHDLTYERDRSILIVQGSAARKARIVIQRPGEFPRDVTVERFFYNLKTKAIEARGIEARAR